MATEDQLASGDILELVDQVPVAVARGDALSFEEAEQVRARGADAEALAPRGLRHVSPGLWSSVAMSPAVLQTGVEISSTDCISSARPLVELAVHRRGQHRVDVLDEV